MSVKDKSIDSSSLSKYVNHYEKIKDLKKPYVKSQDLMKKLNFMFYMINHYLKFLMINAILQVLYSR